jgi:hypothetical protein
MLPRHDGQIGAFLMNKGWLRRALNGGRYNGRDRTRQLERYVVACGELAGFLESHGEAPGSAADRRDYAQGLLRDGWTRDDLFALALPIPSPWPGAKARDSGAIAPPHAEEGEELYEAVDRIGMELRATGEL